MKVYELLASPASWIKNDYSRKEDGSPTFCLSEEACCWCLAGALVRCYEDFSNEKRKLEAKVGNIIRWNDSLERTHADVINLCRDLDI